MKNAISLCPIEEAMILLGGRWPTLLLYYLKSGASPLRFSGATIQASLTEC